MNGIPLSSASEQQRVLLPEVTHPHEAQHRTRSKRLSTRMNTKLDQVIKRSIFARPIQSDRVITGKCDETTTAAEKRKQKQAHIPFSENSATMHLLRYEWRHLAHCTRREERPAIPTY